MLNNIARKWCPAARQGPIYKPTRSKLNPKCSYNSTGAFCWAYHPMLLLVGFQRINRLANHITGCWLSSLGECTRRMMWGRSNRDTEVYGEFPPLPALGVGCAIEVPLKGQGGGLTTFNPSITVNPSLHLLCLSWPLLRTGWKGVFKTEVCLVVQSYNLICRRPPPRTVVKEIFTSLKAPIPQSENTPWHAKVLHLLSHLSKSTNVTLCNIWTVAFLLLVYTIW